MRKKKEYTRIHMHTLSGVPLQPDGRDELEHLHLLVHLRCRKMHCFIYIYE